MEVCPLDPVERRVPPSGASREAMWRCVPCTQDTQESGVFHGVEGIGMVSSFKNVLRFVVRRLRTTDCGKFESVGKYVFEHGEQDAKSAEFSAGPLHYEKMDKLRSSSLRKPQTNV